MLMYSPQNEELAPLTQYCHPMQCSQTISWRRYGQWTRG